jgi:WD40 repeat protein
VQDYAGGDLLVAHRPHARVGMFSLDFSPDGRWRASEADDGVMLFDLQGRSPFAELTSLDCEEVFFHPDGRRLFAATEQGFLAWELAPAAGTGLAREPVVLVPGRCKRAAISADGRAVAVGIHGEAGEARVRLWVLGLDGGRDRLSLDSFQHTDQLSLSPYGRWLAVGNRGGRETGVHDLEGVLPPFAFTRVLGAHFPRFDPAGEWLLVSTREGILALRLGSREEERLLPGIDAAGEPVGSLAFSRDGRHLSRTVEAGCVELLDARSLERVFLLSPPPRATDHLARLRPRRTHPRRRHLRGDGPPLAPRSLADRTRRPRPRASAAGRELRPEPLRERGHRRERGGGIAVRRPDFPLRSVRPGHLGDTRVRAHG